MAKTKSRLLAATKLSDYHISRIIRYFAYGISAVDAAREVRVSYVTIRRIYALVRARMIELTVYRSLDDYIREMEDVEKNAGADWDDHAFFDHLKEKLHRLRGGAPDKSGQHTAEIIYRWDEADRGRAQQAIHYAEILKLVRLSGPLNRPMTKEGREEWQALDMGRQVKVKALGDGLTATSDSVGRYKVRPGIVTSTAGG